MKDANPSLKASIQLRIRLINEYFEKNNKYNKAVSKISEEIRTILKKNPKETTSIIQDKQKFNELFADLYF